MKVGASVGPSYPRPLAETEAEAWAAAKRAAALDAPSDAVYARRNGDSSPRRPTPAYLAENQPTPADGFHGSNVDLGTLGEVQARLEALTQRLDQALSAYHEARCRTATLRGTYNERKRDAYLGHRQKHQHAEAAARAEQDATTEARRLSAAECDAECAQAALETLSTIVSATQTRERAIEVQLRLDGLAR